MAAVFAILASPFYKIAWSRANRSGDGEADYFGFGDRGGHGGGICNRGKLGINNCIIAGNRTGDGGMGSYPSSGGVISIGAPGGPGGDGGSGGGIFNAGEMSVNTSAVYANTTGDGNYGAVTANGGSGGDGGGLYNIGILSIATSTISSNGCGLGANGERGYSFSSNGGNGGNGAGIYNSGALTVISSTVTLNHAGVVGRGGPPPDSWNPSRPGPGEDGIAGVGGGLANAGPSTNVICLNSIIAQNFSSNDQPDGSDMFGDFTSGAFNLIGIADGSTGFVNGVDSNQIGSSIAPIDPMLGPLQMNGGFTPTHALLSGSPAIDQGNSFGLTTDQRGHKRPQTFRNIIPAPGGDGSDIGAFELDAP